ncbi:MAG: hypothetical protein Q9211_003440 [Gyalolechia sp. 1 TL-2023]
MKVHGPKKYRSACFAAVFVDGQNLMPSRLHLVSHDRKRKLIDWESDADILFQPATKRHIPASFGDDISHQALTQYTLKPFDWTATEPATPISPLGFSDKKARTEGFNFADLRRFARQGGPDLSDLRGYRRPRKTSSSHPSMNASQSGSRKRHWYDGSNPSDLNQEIRRLLSRYIEPSTDTSRPLLPNYFTEGKGQSGSTHVCELQALHDGGLGARGIEAIRNYIDPQTVYDGNAYTITSTYHPTGLLTLYTMHAVEAKGQVYPAEFRMIQVRSFAMTDSPATFREGATWLRNARDLMKEYRDQHIAAANSKVQTTASSGLPSFGTLRSDEPPRLESETSADELSLGSELARCRKHQPKVHLGKLRNSG